MTLMLSFNTYYNNLWMNPYWSTLTAPHGMGVVIIIQDLPSIHYQGYGRCCSRVDVISSCNQKQFRKFLYVELKELPF